MVIPALSNRVALVFGLLTLMLQPLLWLAERAVQRADQRAAASAIGKAERKLADTLRAALIDMGWAHAADLPDGFFLEAIYEDAPCSDHVRAERCARRLRPLAPRPSQQDAPSLKPAERARLAPIALPVKATARAPPRVLENPSPRRAWSRQAAGAVRGGVGF